MTQIHMNLKFHMEFGYLTSAFAHLEADVRFVIAALAFNSDSVIAAAFLDGSHFATNLATFKKLGLTFVGDETRFLEIAARAEKLRAIRNLFIHGLWSAGSFGEENGFATVKNLRTKHEDGELGRTWTHGSSEQFSLTNFGEILMEVSEISAKLRELRVWLEKSENVEFGYLGVTSMSGRIEKPIGS